MFLSWSKVRGRSRNMSVTTHSYMVIVVTYALFIIREFWLTTNKHQALRIVSRWFHQKASHLGLMEIYTSWRVTPTTSIGSGLSPQTVASTILLVPSQSATASRQTDVNAMISGNCWQPRHCSAILLQLQLHLMAFYTWQTWATCVSFPLFLNYPPCSLDTLK